MGDHHFGNFTMGIIALLINTTGEFVTERFSASVDMFVFTLTSPPISLTRVSMSSSGIRLGVPPPKKIVLALVIPCLACACFHSLKRHCSILG